MVLARAVFESVSEHFGEVVVDFASVPDEKNDYLIFLRVYLVDYSIIAYSGAPEI